MLRALSNPTTLKRVAHVTVVALSTVASLVLIGAVPADWAVSRKPAVAPAVELPALPESDRDDHVAADADVFAEAVPAVATLPATIDLLTEALPTDAVPVTPRTRTMRMVVTAYCPCTKCCGPRAQGVTASGKSVDYNDGRFVAADTTVLPFGKKVVVPGYANEAAVEVIDRGGAIKGNRLDLYFVSHEDALIWGRQTLDVTVFE